METIVDAWKKVRAEQEAEEQISGESVVSDYDKSHLGQKKKDS